MNNHNLLGTVVGIFLAIVGLVVIAVLGVSQIVVRVKTNNLEEVSSVQEEQLDGAEQSEEHLDEVAVDKQEPDHKEVYVEVETEPEKVFEGSKEELEEVEQDELITYVGQVLSGTEVVDIVKEFQGKQVAILVATKMVIDGTTAFNEPDANIASDTPTVGAKGTTGILNTIGEDMSDKLTFVNYGAVLKGSEGKAMLDFAEGYFISEGLDFEGKAYITNTQIENIETPGAAENLDSYMQMQACLVKDSTDKVIGIAFYSTY